MTGCRVYGVSTWDLQLAGAVQKNIIITPEDEPTIQVHRLDIAQFIYLVLKQRGNPACHRYHHIQGRADPRPLYGTAKAVLDGIREQLRTRDYVPVLFDFDKPENRDTHETITTLARIARFAIADITDAKSIPQELVSIV